MLQDNTVLILLLRMLALGLSAWVMIDSQDFKEPKLDAQVVTKFLPALMSLMVDDQVRQLSTRLPPDEREAAITIIEHSGPLPDAVEAYIQESSVASILAMYYTLHAARHKDRVGLLRILTVLANCKDDRAFEDPFLHSLVSSSTNFHHLKISRENLNLQFSFPSILLAPFDKEFQQDSVFILTSNKCHKYNKLLF